jgi:hypothetical protein
LGLIDFNEKEINDWDQRHNNKAHNYQNRLKRFKPVFIVNDVDVYEN